MRIIESSLKKSNIVMYLIDVSWVRNLFPKISSFSLDMDIYELSGRRSLKICVPDEGSVDLLVPGLQNYKKKWPFPKLKALILGRKKRKERFFSGIELGDKTCSKEMIMNDGRFNVTLPNEQDQFKIDHNIIMANIMTNMINSFRDINTKHSSPYYDVTRREVILRCSELAVLSTNFLFRCKG
ncbi:hypothetical protein QVD17_31162 [Tagetes erecta]|uniref:Uncharacterized protein n=1 Tax=Tagetes erecta TaxID=13708 RepID=A0AAD8NNW5_TARER|nr:hypothetical protein QVD17_31162 [Tagetes erecta]